MDEAVATGGLHGRVTQQAMASLPYVITEASMREAEGTPPVGDAIASQALELRPALASTVQGPRNAGFFVRRAFVRRSSGDFDGATADYAAALRLNSTHFVASFNLGFCHLRLGRPRAAVATFRRCVALRVTSAAAWFNLGVSLYCCGQQDGALAAWARAVEIDPRPQFARVRALAHRRRGDFAESIADYAAASGGAAGRASAAGKRAPGSRTGRGRHRAVQERCGGDPVFAAPDFRPLPNPVFTPEARQRAARLLVRPSASRGLEDVQFLRDFTRGVPFLAQLPDAVHLELCQHVRAVALRPGQRLFAQGEPSTCFYLVLFGRLVARAHATDAKGSDANSGDVMSASAAAAAAASTGDALASTGASGGRGHGALPQPTSRSRRRAGVAERMARMSAEQQARAREARVGAAVQPPDQGSADTSASSHDPLVPKLHLWASQRPGSASSRGSAASGGSAVTLLAVEDEEETWEGAPSWESLFGHRDWSRDTMGPPCDIAPTGRDPFACTGAAATAATFMGYPAIASRATALPSVLATADAGPTPVPGVSADVLRGRSSGHQRKEAPLDRFRRAVRLVVAARGFGGENKAHKFMRAALEAAGAGTELWAQAHRAGLVGAHTELATARQETDAITQRLEELGLTEGDVAGTGRHGGGDASRRAVGSKLWRARAVPRAMWYEAELMDRSFAVVRAREALLGAGSPVPEEREEDAEEKEEEDGHCGASDSGAAAEGERPPLLFAASREHAWAVFPDVPDAEERQRMSQNRAERVFGQKVAELLPGETTGELCLLGARAPDDVGGDGAERREDAVPPNSSAGVRDGAEAAADALAFQPAPLRRATLIAAEPSLVLALNTNALQQVLAVQRAREVEALEHFLAGIPLFGGVPVTDLERLARAARPRKLLTDQVLLAEGHALPGMVIVRTGQCRVLHGLQVRSRYPQPPADRSDAGGESKPCAGSDGEGGNSAGGGGPRGRQSAVEAVASAGKDEERQARAQDALLQRLPSSVAARQEFSIDTSRVSDLWGAHGRARSALAARLAAAPRAPAPSPRSQHDDASPRGPPARSPRAALSLVKEACQTVRVAMEAAGPQHNRGKGKDVGSMGPYDHVGEELVLQIRRSPAQRGREGTESQPSSPPGPPRPARMVRCRACCHHRAMVDTPRR